MLVAPRNVHVLRIESVGRLRYYRDDLSMFDEWGSKYLTSREICSQSRAWRPLASRDVVRTVGLRACIGERDTGGASTCEEKSERFTGAELFTAVNSIGVSGWERD